MRLFKKNYQAQTDEALMLLFQRGDKKAFECIYDRYANHLVNFFYQKLWQNQLKSEDAAQDIFTKIISNPTIFDAKQNFKTWLFSVAFNRCKNEYKKHEVRKNTKYDLPEHHQPAIKNTLSDQLLDEQNFGESLANCLNNMDDKHASVFRLRHEDGLTMKEIAQVLGINEGTVKSRLHNVTKQLASDLSVYRKIIER